MRRLKPTSLSQEGAAVAADGVRNPTSGEVERERRIVFAACVGDDVAAVRRVLDALHTGWVSGALGRDTRNNAEIAAAGCRAAGLAQD